MKDTFSYRFKNFRKLKGITQQEVAQVLQVSKQMISKYENGIALPSSSRLVNLSKFYGVKVDHFFQTFSVDIGEIKFRKKKFGKRREEALKEKIKIELENYLWIENNLGISKEFKNPIKNIFINDFSDVRKAVSKLRKQWELGSDPIHNIIQLFEDKEIKVIELGENNNKEESNFYARFDGLSGFANSKYPIIVVNKSFAVERKRFTLLHELAHLLMPNIKNLNDFKMEEKYCNYFASEMLFPKEFVLKEFGNSRKRIDAEEFIAIQKKYGISIQAIIYRLVDAEIISGERQIQFYRKIKSNKKLETMVNTQRFATPEKSYRYKRLVHRALAQENISTSKAAFLLDENIEKVKKEMLLI